MALKRIGILDFGFRFENSTYNGIYDLVNEAILLEEMGFSRIWYAEHIISANTIWSYPDVIVAMVSAYTQKINVGVAGTSVRYNNPAKIANDYQLMSTAFSNRIDLGFSKGQSSFFESYMTENNIPFQNGWNSSQLNERIKLVISSMDKFPQLKKPNLWYLTGSATGYATSVELGANCCRTLMHKHVDLHHHSALHDAYLKNFYQKYHSIPEYNVCVAGSVQNNPKLIHKIKNKNEHILNSDHYLCGPKAYVEEKLHHYAEVYQVEEIIFYEMSSDLKDRKRSFAALANIMY
ncbi:MAG: luciferase-like protein [Segetibacter sp.]|nr:luciferase-like protein [Segetibacter sp.]